jgi:ribosome-binding factor A
MSEQNLDTKSRRLSRVEKTLREIIGQQLMTMTSFFEGALVTLVRVSCSPDLRHAQVFVSVFGDENDITDEEVLDVLEEHRAVIQHKIAKELPMKFCPKLKFVLDGSIEKLVHVSELLNESNTKGE